MKTASFLFALALVGAGVGFAANPAPPSGTTMIELPGDVGPTLKPGPGVEVAQEHCTQCHSTAYVAVQPPLTASQWAAEVTKMRKVYGAQISNDAANTIVQYLTTKYAKQ